MGYKQIATLDDLPVVDATLSATSENPVQNKVVKAALDKKIDEPTNNGLVRKFMSGMYGTMGVDTTMPTSPTDNGVPTTKLLKDYVEDNTSNPLQLSDTNLQKSGLLIQTYTPAGSTPGTIGTRTYSVIERDVSTLDDTNTGRGKVPSSYVVGNYVKESVSAEQIRSDNTFSNALKGSKSGEGFLIDDVSPITHEMEVKISGDTVEDLTTVKVKKQGKNLIPFPYQQLTLGTSTYNGVDFTVYEDGSILINGTATKSTTKYLYNNVTDLLGLKSGVTISGSKNASDDTQQGNVYFLCNYYNSTGTMTQGLVASTTPSGTKTITDEWKGLGIYINVPNGKTVNNLLIKPQLEIGATATEYELYITPTEYIPTADGTVNGVTSLYPNTTLTTDTGGVIINCEYNRDINKARDILDKLSKNFELIEQFTLTEDVTQIYRSQKPNGEAYNFNDVIMTLHIPIIEQGSTEAYGGNFLYIVNSETDIANNRVVAQGGVFKKGQVGNISVRAKIEGGIVFGTYGASAGNTSNKQSAFTSYSNMNMLPAENITSVLFTFFGQPIFSGTTIKIYAR